MVGRRRRAVAPVDITGFLSYRVLMLSNTLGRWAAREYPMRFGLTLPEWRVLSVLAIRGTSTAHAIGDALSIDKAWVSRTLAALARRGLLRTNRDPSDRRRRLIGLTGHGRALCARVSRASVERQRRLVADLSPRALARFEATLAALQTRAEAMLDEQQRAAARRPRGATARAVRPATS